MFLATHRVGFGAGQAALPPSLKAFTLNHWNGSNGADATTSADQVPGVTWTQAGGINATLTTSVKQFGTASATGAYNGSTQPELKTNDIGIDITGSLTTELFGRVNQSGANWGDCLIQFENNSGSAYGYIELWNAACYFNILNSSFGNIIAPGSAGTVVADTFYHFAYVRDVVAGTHAVYFNGNRINLTSSSQDIGAFDVVHIIFGGDVSGNGAWVDEIRVRNDVQYTGATYTVPTAEFSA